MLYYGYIELYNNGKTYIIFFSSNLSYCHKVLECLVRLSIRKVVNVLFMFNNNLVESYIHTKKYKLRIVEDSGFLPQHQRYPTRLSRFLDPFCRKSQQLYKICTHQLEYQIMSNPSTTGTNQENIYNYKKAY